jgi:hypothetical protein
MAALGHERRFRDIRDESGLPDSFDTHSLCYKAVQVAQLMLHRAAFFRYLLIDDDVHLIPELG